MEANDRVSGREETRSGSDSGGRGESAYPHARAPGEVAESFEVDLERGLSEEDAARRLERYGPNRLPERGGRSLPKIVLGQFRDPLILLLLGASVAAAIIGSFANAGFILAVVLFNTVIGTIQDYNAERSAAALRAVLAREATVRRGAARRRVPVDEVVIGDVVLLEGGMSVPADARLIRTEALRVDESALTGESVPVEKDAEASLEKGAVLPDRVTMVYAGTIATRGRAEAIVTGTGLDTSLGGIAESVAQTGGKPPLVVRMERFTRQIAFATVSLVLLLGVVLVAQGIPLDDVFFLAVALTVSAIPAGLPAAITVALAIASRRMSERNVIARVLPAVEGLGTTTLIATDKTGTLTENRLTVRRVVSIDGEEVEIPGGSLQTEIDEPPELRDWLRRLAVAGVRANEAELRVDEDGEIHPVGDRVDVGFLVLARKLGLDERQIRAEARQVERIPYESSRKFAASVDEDDGRTVASMKGATESLVEICEGLDRERVEKLEHDLASRGFRVLAVAAEELDAAERGENAFRGLTFLGFVCLTDPVRAGVVESVQKCHRAGVEVRMITGDHPSTGMAIARRIGIASEDDEAVTESELSGLDEEESAERIARAEVYARVPPQRKASIVEILQGRGHYLAVTGDGVNDAPALRAANIGIAMGQAGTDVARDTADLILTDDNFSSIVNGIEEGRVAYDNVRKVTWLLISTAIGEVLLFFLALAAGQPLPLVPAQLLWLNLVTNGIQDVFLAFEGREPGVLARPPRAPGQPLFDRFLVEESLVSGITIGMVAFGAFTVLRELVDLGTFDARNLTLLLMVFLENAHALSCRSERRSILAVPLAANRLLILGILLAQAVHIGALYAPGLSTVLEVAPVTLEQYLALLPLTLLLLGVDEAHKRFRHGAANAA